MSDTKFCQFCGKSIPSDALFCASCGSQVEESTSYGQQAAAYQPQPQPQQQQYYQAQPNPSIIINNNTSYRDPSKLRNKWISLALCFFTVFGHKFYEGKIGMGVLYLFTGGLFGIGWFVDLFVLACKPTEYYVE